MIGDIMGISRLRMGTDGKGVSTLVTFFDCPLHCKYCINNYCHKDARKYTEGYEEIPRGAFTPEEIVEILKKDDIYFRMSGGGVVFGGGEPLLQSAFIHEVCTLCDPAWEKRIETSLNVPWRYIEPLLSDMNEWIIDVKILDYFLYKEYTGVDNDELIKNLLHIKKYVDPTKLHIRLPRIPDYTTEENLEKSANWLQKTLHVEPEIFDYYKIPIINQKKRDKNPCFMDEDDE